MEVKPNGNLQIVVEDKKRSDRGSIRNYLARYENDEIEDLQSWRQKRDD